VKILVVEDEIEHRQYLADVIRGWDHEVIEAADGQQALQILSGTVVDVLITDLMMPRMDGFELLRTLGADGRMPPAIVMTAFGSLEKALATVHDLGGYWFLEKPIDVSSLKILLTRAGVQSRLAAENDELRRELAFRGVMGDLVGRSAPMLQVFDLIRQVAPTSAAVLITGESGTGKELVARAIHENSRRKGGPFIALNCAAMPETLIESELFGHEKGAFTGAVERRIGALEAGKGGTLFLDELGEMPMPMQAKLLRFLEDFQFRRLGSRQELKADVRILTATNRDPLKAIQEGKMREDLYYRVNVFQIHLPPLRDRKEDIPLITEAMIHNLNRKHDTRVTHASAEFLATLQNRDWEGNVRELRNIVERAVILTGSGPIRSSQIAAVRIPITGDSSEGLPFEPVVETLSPSEVSAVGTGSTQVFDPNLVPVKVGMTIGEAERLLISATLEHTGMNKTRAASMLDISTRTLHTKLGQYRLIAEDAPAEDELQAKA
jgi:DNA-binding NtrC family response regulator